MVNDVVELLRQQQAAHPAPVGSPLAGLLQHDLRHRLAGGVRSPAAAARPAARWPACAGGSPAACRTRPATVSGCGPVRSIADGGGCATPAGGGADHEGLVGRPCGPAWRWRCCRSPTVCERSRAAVSASDACQAMRVTAAGACVAPGGEAWQVRNGGPAGLTGSVKMSSQVSFTGGPPGSPAGQQVHDLPDRRIAGVLAGRLDQQHLAGLEPVAVARPPTSRWRRPAGTARCRRTSRRAMGMSAVRFHR